MQKMNKMGSHLLLGMNHDFLHSPYQCSSSCKILYSLCRIGLENDRLNKPNNNANYCKIKTIYRAAKHTREPIRKGASSWYM